MLSVKYKLKVSFIFTAVSVRAICSNFDFASVRNNHFIERRPNGKYISAVCNFSLLEIYLEIYVLAEAT